MIRTKDSLNPEIQRINEAHFWDHYNYVTSGCAMATAATMKIKILHPIPIGMDGLGPGSFVKPKPRSTSPDRGRAK